MKFSDVKRIVIPRDTSQSYCVYLPSAYHSPKKLPVIFLFDSHGDGTLAINHAKEAAERFGYILVGSNNSKNGQEDMEHIVNLLFTDVFDHFSIDVRRVYTAGFSGGGRVASNLAISSDRIKGVITCSAGLPQFNPQTTRHKFDICAITGKEDFNYDEVESLREELDGTGWRYIIEAFDGGHEWPPVTYITDAVLWFELNAMRDGLIPTDASLVDQTFDSISSNIAKYYHNNQYVKAELECKKGISYLFTLHNIHAFEKERDDLKSTDGYKLEIQKEERIKELEKQLRDGYLQNFFSGDSAWWGKEIKSLNEKLTISNDLLTKQMYSRVKGFLGIICYSYTSKAIASNNIELTNRCLKIYENLEPKNPDLFFFKAIVCDRTNQPDKAVMMLKTAMDYGFTDQYKIKEMFSQRVQKNFLR